MTKDRYNELMGDLKKELTKEEIEGGWHFCYYWDCLLIHSSWPEYESCECPMGKD